MCSPAWSWSLDPFASAFQAWTATWLQGYTADDILCHESARDCMCTYTHSSVSIHTEYIDVHACMYVFMCFSPYIPVFSSVGKHHRGCFSPSRLPGDATRPQQSGTCGAPGALSHTVSCRLGLEPDGSTCRLVCLWPRACDSPMWLSGLVHKMGHS